MPFGIILLLCAVLGLLLIYMLKLHAMNRLLPPGPPIIFVYLGLLAKKKRYPIDGFKILRKKYGDVFSLSLGHKTTIVINGWKSIREVFVDNSKLTSNRPDNFFFKQVHQKKGIVGADGELWTQHRTFAMKSLNSLGFGKRIMEARIVEEFQTLIKELHLSDGKAIYLRDLLRMCMTNIVFSVAMGKSFSYKDKDFSDVVKAAETSIKLNSTVGPLAVFPFLRYVPGDYFNAKHMLEIVDDIYKFFNSTIGKGERASENYVDSFLEERNLLESNGKQSTFTEFQLARCLADFLGAGSETSTSVIRWAVLYFMHNPEIPEKMRREMKENVGDSVPSLEDRDSLPYCRSVIAEIMRIKPVTPLAAPHSNNVDLCINDTVIPKGSTLLINVSSIFEDPELFEEPEVFKPSRFLNKHGDYVPSEHINSLFGAGKRICPGDSLAKMELFLGITALVKSFTFEPELPGCLPPIIGCLGVTYCPDPFKVRFLSLNT